jgi:hypothetical protein
MEIKKFLRVQIYLIYRADQQGLIQDCTFPDFFLPL